MIGKTWHARQESEVHTTKGRAHGRAGRGCRYRLSGVLYHNKEFYVTTKIAHPVSRPEILSRNRFELGLGHLGRDIRFPVATELAILCCDKVGFPSIATVKLM